MRAPACNPAWRHFCMEDGRAARPQSNDASISGVRPQRRDSRGREIVRTHAADATACCPSGKATLRVPRQELALPVPAAAASPARMRAAADFFRVRPFSSRQAFCARRVFSWRRVFSSRPPFSRQLSLAFSRPFFSSPLISSQAWISAPNATCPASPLRISSF